MANSNFALSKLSVILKVFIYSVSEGVKSDIMSSEFSMSDCNSSISERSASTDPTREADSPEVDDDVFERRLVAETSRDKSAVFPAASEEDIL